MYVQGESLKAVTAVRMRFFQLPDRQGWSLANNHHGVNMGTGILALYSQSPDWIKAAIIIGVPAGALALLWILLWYRVEMKRIERVFSPPFRG